MKERVTDYLTLVLGCELCNTLKDMATLEFALPQGPLISGTTHRVLQPGQRIVALSKSGICKNVIQRPDSLRRSWHISLQVDENEVLWRLHR